MKVWKAVVAYLIAVLWLFGAYKAGDWLGTVLANWIND